MYPRSLVAWLLSAYTTLTGPRCTSISYLNLAIVCFVPTLSLTNLLPV